MSVQASYDFKLQAIEVPDMDQDLGDDPSITHEIKGNTGDPTGSSASPPVTKKFAGRVALAAGVATLDLTALDDGNLPDIDFTGLKVQFVKIVAVPGNSAAVKIKEGALFGYEIFGAGAPECTLFGDADNGDIAMHRFMDTLADVSATLKNIDLSGSGTDAVDIILIAG